MQTPPRSLARRVLAPVALLPLAAIALAGCGANPSGPTPAQSASGSGSLLSRSGLAGLTTEQIVDKLDASEDDRAAGPAGSVRPDELILTDTRSGEKQSLPMPADKFYLAMAPYESKTHECFNHNLATCKGELTNQPVHITLVDAAGTTVVDKDVTTYANGFAGVWVPRDIAGRLTVSAKGKSVTVPVSTHREDPTCLTTPLKLA